MILKVIFYLYLEVFTFFFTSVLLGVTYVLTKANYKKRKELRLTEYKMYLKLSDSFTNRRR